MTVSRLSLYIDPRDIPMKIKCATDQELKVLSENDGYTNHYKACIRKEIDIRKQQERPWLRETSSL